jgi:hypothetical protein
MPDALPGQRGADGNLLYGMLALQMNFVSRDALLAAMQAWVFDKARPLGQILQERGQLTPERRQALDHMLAEHLKTHDDDPHKSLAAVAVPDALRDDLCRLADPDVQASLAGAADPNATRPYVPATTPDGGRYLILRPHARGGLGEVSVALDQELHREVALKEIQPRFASDAESRGRFVQEAEITGGLEHPGIVPVYGLGTYPDGRPFYAMRFIQGETLKDAARKLHAGAPGVTLRGLLTRFVAVCNAIAYAHSRGVLHRDLKPANVMLGKYGETLVVDWGLAKAVGHALAGNAGESFDEATLRPHSGDSSMETRMGSAIGTPAYMSPEQAAGQLERISPASDVYGLGATLYTVLTGHAPVESQDTAEALERVRKGERANLGRDRRRPIQVSGQPARPDPRCRIQSEGNLPGVGRRRGDRARMGRRARRGSMRVSGTCRPGLWPGLQPGWIAFGVGRRRWDRARVGHGWGFTAARLPRPHERGQLRGVQPGWIAPGLGRRRRDRTRLGRGRGRRGLCPQAPQGVCRWLSL